VRAYLGSQHHAGPGVMSEPGRQSITLHVGPRAIGAARWGRFAPNMEDAAKPQTTDIKTRTVPLDETRTMLA
jgi:hypothetical protein